MKRITSLFVFTLVISFVGYSQVGIGTITPTADTMLEIETLSSQNGGSGVILNMQGTSNAPRVKYGIISNFDNVTGGYGLTGLKNQFGSVGNLFSTGVQNEFTGNGTRGKHGVVNYFSTNEQGYKWGMRNFFNSDAAGEVRAVGNLFQGDTNDDKFGVRSEFSGTGSNQHGTYNSFRGASSRNFGLYNGFATDGSTQDYGVYNVFGSDLTTDVTGLYNHFGNGVNRATGVLYGVRNFFTSIATTDDKYGYYNFMPTNMGGTHYGIYSSVLRTNSFAGYFLGDVAIGTTIANTYKLPASRGMANQVIQTDGSGNANWADATTFGAQEINDLTDGKTDGSSLFLGIDAGLNDDGSDNRNVGFGSRVLFNNTTGHDNTASGFNALFNNTTGNNNTANGERALFSNTIGNYNSASGYTALYNNTTGNDNTAYGAGALYANIIGVNNTAIGRSALSSNFGYNNTVVGASALANNSTGNNNTAIGTSALFNNVMGTQNVAIGSFAGNFETGSNKLYIENSDAGPSTALVYGDFGADNTTTSNMLRINGELQIGNSASNRYAMPVADGLANQVLQTNGAGAVSWGAVARTVSNGLTLSGSDVRLGGVLTQITNIPHGVYNLTHNLNGTGDFIIQDNGTNHFEVRDNGNSYFGGSSSWYQTDTSGTQVASLLGIGNDGALIINNGGSAQHFIYGGGTTWFNSLGIDTDFQVSGDTNTDLFYVDAGTDNIGIRTATPLSDIHLKESSTSENGGGGVAIESSSSSNNWRIYHSGSHFSFAENGVRRAYVTAATGAYMVTSDRNLKKNISEVMEKTLPKLSEIKVYTYHYKDQNPSEEKTLGLMAQEVKPHFPELVQTNEDGNLGINYAGFSVVAIQAIKEQQHQIDAQQKEIQELKVLVNQLIQKKE